jgi:hypothetical protein
MKDAYFLSSTVLSRIALLFLANIFAFTVVFMGTGALHSTTAQSHAKNRRTTRAAICGNPTVTCRTSVTFEPHDLPFRVPKSGVIIDTERFYAIILKSLTPKEYDCELFIPEEDRLAAQALFPANKVFTSRCTEAGNLFYNDENRPGFANISDTHRIMAVYAGGTLAEAKRVLAAVKATGKFPGANLRRMSTGFNGT